MLLFQLIRKNSSMGLLQNLKFESTFSYGENGVY